LEAKEGEKLLFGWVKAREGDWGKQRKVQVEKKKGSSHVSRGRNAQKEEIGSELGSVCVRD